MKKYLCFCFLCWIGEFPIAAQQVDQVVNAYFNTIGGLEKWKAITKVKLIRSHSYANGEVFMNTIYLVPNHALRYESVLESGSNHIIYAINEQKGWRLNTISEGYQRLLITDIPSDDCSFFLEETDFFFGLLHRSDAVFEYRGTTKRNNREVVEISMKDAVGRKRSYFFDTQTHLLLEMTGDIAVLGMGMPAVSTVQLDDYREINGLCYPFKQTIAAKQLMFGQAQVFTLESIDLNATFDMKLFEKGQH